MAVTAAAPIREHEKPMSWARAIVIATGFFFITAIFLGQIPGYVFTVSTSATLTSFEQGFLALGLLSLGLGLIALEISFLYDPKPVIPWPLFAVGGLGIAAVGAVILFAAGTGIIPQFVPTVADKYYISAIWFQPNSIDLVSVGLVAALVGLGMFFVAVLNPWVLSGRAFGPARDLLVRVCITAAIGITLLYLFLFTFAPSIFQPTVHEKTSTFLGSPSAFGNILLFIGLSFALLGLLIWLLPVMTQKRQEFMPGIYFNGVVILLAMVAIPLLLAWFFVYPVVYGIHQIDTTQFWVQCSQAKHIPESCTFTPYTGYIICAAVFGGLFTLLLVGYYFWTTRRNAVVIGGTGALIWLGLAASVIHTSYTPELATQIPTGLFIAASICILAFLYTWATQREFAPTRPQPLGCVGQWLVLGTLLLVVLFGYALLSVPKFFELESGLAFFYEPGVGGLHDAFWVFALMGGIALLQLALLARRRPMSDLRKFAFWVMLFAVTLMLIAGIQGFHYDFFSQGGLQVVEASHVIMFVAIIFEVIGIGVSLVGALRAGAGRWALGIVIPALVGAAFAAVIYSLSYASPPINYPELVIFGIAIAMAGAFTYCALGPDTREEAAAYANGASPANGGVAATNGGAASPATR
jgi:hypothetical protein